MYTLEPKNNTSPLCVQWTLIPQIIPLLTLTLVRIWYAKSTPNVPGVEVSFFELHLSTWDMLYARCVLI